MRAEDDEPEGEMTEGMAHVNIEREDNEESVGSKSSWDSIIDGVGFHEPSEVDVVKRDRPTCDPRKLYLDSCATHSSMFATEFLDKCIRTGVTLRQNCNAGSRLTNRMGFWSVWKFWENEDGIANLLSEPEIEKLGYEVTIMQGKRTVFSPDRKTKWIFKKDKGVCDGMPFLDMTKMEEHEFQVNEDELAALIEAGVIRPGGSASEGRDGVVMIKTVSDDWADNPIS
jgi:hypothetical protein